MNYNEFQDYLNHPIDGDKNFATMYTQLVKFVYEMHIENDILKNKVETLEYKIDTLQYDINTIRSDTSKMKYHVEPDLRYIV
jgi:hypothetical protein